MRPRSSLYAFIHFSILVVCSSILSFSFFMTEASLLRGLNTSGREPWEPLFWNLVLYVFPGTVFLIGMVPGHYLLLALTKFIAGDTLRKARPDQEI